MKREKGVILLCTLAIMVILSILLMVGVYRMQSSVMATKKVIWEIKSYWAARAGNTVAADNAISNNGKFPQDVFIGKYGGEDGGFNVTKEANCITGEDDSSNSKFVIYYRNNRTSENTSVTAIKESSVIEHFANASLGNNDIYLLSVGKSGPSICGLELIYKVFANNNFNGISSQKLMTSEQSVSASAAIFASGDIIANLTNKLYIKPTDDTKGCIVAKGKISITGAGGEPNIDGSGSVQAYDGALFSSSCNINGQSITPDFTGQNLTDYGINVYPSKETVFPEIEQPKPSRDTPTIPSGTYCFIEMPTKYTNYEFEAVINQQFHGNALSLKDYKEAYYDKQDHYYDDSQNTTSQAISPCLEDYITSSNPEKTAEEDIFDKIFEKNVECDDGALKESYKMYLRNKVNGAISSYMATADVGYKNYDPFFIPKSTNIVDEGNKSILLSFKDLTEARVLSNFLDSLYLSDENIENMGEDADEKLKQGRLISFLIGKIKQCVAALEKEKLKGQFKEALEGSKYIAEKIYYNPEKSNESDYFTILCPSNDFNPDTRVSIYKDKFTKALPNLRFIRNSSELKMKLDTSVKVEDGFLNFATYERMEKSDTGVSFGSIHIGFDPFCYKTAVKRRGVVDFGQSEGTERGIYANNINIKGLIQGNGQIVSDKDVSIEAGAGVNSGEENWVAIYAGNDIKLTKISAGEGNMSSVGDVQSGKKSDFSDTVLKMVNNYFTKNGWEKIDLKNLSETDIEHLNSLDTNILSYINIYCSEENSRLVPKLRGYDTTEGNPVKTDPKTDEYEANTDAGNENIMARNSYLKMVEQIKLWAIGDDYAVSSNFRGLLKGKNLTIDVGENTVDFGIEGHIIIGEPGDKKDGVGNIDIRNLHSLTVIYNPALAQSLFSNIEGYNSTVNYLQKSFVTGDVNKAVGAGSFRAFNRI